MWFPVSEFCYDLTRTPFGGILFQIYPSSDLFGEEEGLFEGGALFLREFGGIVFGEFPWSFLMDPDGPPKRTCWNLKGQIFYEIHVYYMYIVHIFVFEKVLHFHIFFVLLIYSCWRQSGTNPINCFSIWKIWQIPPKPNKFLITQNPWLPTLCLLCIIGKLIGKLSYINKHTMINYCAPNCLINLHYFYSFVQLLDSEMQNYTDALHSNTVFFGYVNLMRSSNCTQLLWLRNKSSFSYLHFHPALP